MDVFISYARSSSRQAAVSLHQELGGGSGKAFLDTTEIDFGERFPARLVDALFAAKVFVALTDALYFRRWYCLFEFRAAMAPFSLTGDHRDLARDHIVVALPPEGLAEEELWHLPPQLREINWPSSRDPTALAKLVRGRLRDDMPTLGQLVDRTIGVGRVRREFIETTRLPPPASVTGDHPLVPARGLPLSLGDGFVGRADDLWRVQEALVADAPHVAPIVALEGGAGVGKSRLAVEYLLRFGRFRHRDGWFWIDAGRSLPAQWHEIVRALQPSTPDLPAVLAEYGGIEAKLVDAFRSLGPGHRALVVVDNVPEPSAAVPPAAIDQYFPAVGHVPVLITSRHRLSLAAAGAIRAVPLDVLDADAAIALLGRGVDPGAAVDDLAEISTWVGRLPLALELLNAMLVHRALSPGELAERAAREATTPVLDEAMEVLRAVVPAHTLRGATEALAISYESLPENARRAARLLSWLAPVPIPNELVDAFGPDRIGAAAKVQLVARSFVTSQAVGDTFGTMHAVLADFLRTRAEDQGAEVVDAVRAVLDTITPTRAETPAAWPLLDGCAPHAHALFDRLRGVPPFRQPFETLGLALCTLYLRQGRYHDASGIGLATLDPTGEMISAGELTVDFDTPERKQLVGLLPEALANSGTLDAAVALQEINIEIAEADAGGDNDPRVLRARDNLAEYLRARGSDGDLDTATAIMTSTIPLWRGLDPRSVDTATALNQLGLLLLKREQFDEAAPLLEEALGIVAGHDGAELQTIAGMSNLAYAVEAADTDRAHALREAALQLAGRISLPDSHPTAQTLLGDLGRFARTAGDHARAVQLLARVLAAAAHTRATDDPSVTVMAWELYETQVLAGAASEATRTYDQYLAWVISMTDADLDDRQRIIRDQLQRRSPGDP